MLQQLYLATGNPLNYEDEHVTPPTRHTEFVCTEDETGSVWHVAGEQLCVVCQFFPLSRALLPCRHTCICASCFEKLDRCPMCRSPIKSYFCIRGEEYMPSEPKKTSTKLPTALQWLQDFSERFTDFLGFQRWKELLNDCDKLCTRFDATKFMKIRTPILSQYTNSLIGLSRI